MKRTGMIDIKDILRHRHDLGLPRAQIAAAVGVSAGTVSHVLEPDETIPGHANIRGGAYYSKDGATP